jgi:argininosuccinate synthase
LGTSLARPVIARKQIEIAEREGCQYVSHGCTGKGNDQVRFELAYYALKSDIEVIAPWRLPGKLKYCVVLERNMFKKLGFANIYCVVFFNRFAGRSALLDFAAEKGIQVAQTKAKPWSTDENLFHISYEAGILEDPNITPPKEMWKLTVDPEDAPDAPERITITFEKGIPVKVVNHNDGHEVTEAVELFTYLNTVARRNGVGRIDIVESRFIGVKSRGCYETPGGTVLRTAHKDLEGLTLDGQLRATRDQNITVPYGRSLYNGQYFSPECEFLRKSIDFTQINVTGDVKVKLYKGNTTIEGRVARGPGAKLYDMQESSMDEQGGYNPEDANGFIKIHSIRLKKWTSSE